ncbi:MAG: hypothetical protein LBI64_00830 [Coriobacteriales bacterium]|jgi:predicted RND superfamily exporter protein|nr:hypothetical protein [Coriobacteriales bacterium]
MSRTKHSLKSSEAQAQNKSAPDENKGRSSKEKKQSSARMFSLFGGVVFFSVVVALAVSRNERLRQEVDAQIQAFLKTTKNALIQYQQLVQKMGAITNGIKSVTHKNDSEAPKALPAANNYDLMWEQLERKIR